MKKIAIIIQSLSGGGAERAAANLSKDLSSFYDVSLLVFDGRKRSYPFGGNIIDFEIASSKRKIGRFFTFVKRLIRLKKEKRKGKYDYAISFLTFANLLNVITKCQEKVVVSVRNYMSQNSHSSFEKKLVKFCSQRADLTISLSEGVRTDLIQNFGIAPQKVVTIYNSCDKQWLESAGDQVDNLAKTIDFSQGIITTAGRLTYQKGQWHLLRAYSLIKEEFPNCKIVIFGEGEEKEQLLTYSQKLGIENNVIIPGYLSGFHKIVSRSTAFVFTSIFEGLGNVLLESLACGVPIISTDCNYGPSEILCGSCKDYKDICYATYGLLIPPFSEEKNSEDNLADFEPSDYLLAKAIKLMITDDNLRNKYKKQAIIRSKDFLPANIVLKWKDTLEGLK